MFPESGWSSFDPYEFCSNDEDDYTPNIVADTTPGRSDHASHILTAAQLYFNSPPESPKNWWENNPNFNNYHSNEYRLAVHFG